ncbi:MAG: sulfatase-like hydrolase/transferase [Pirellulaceae bacterium]
MPPKRQKLVALIEHLDDGIGQVLATLEELQLADSTIVVFTSDNGGQIDVGANNGPWRDGKQSMYQGGLLVPCAIHWPGVTTPGTRISRPR